MSLKTFMHDHQLSTIDLMWMDIQGGELMALRGLEERIREVKLIHSEVGLFEIYEGQPLFADIKRYLNKQGFYFVTFTQRGGYSADAVFMNSRFAGKNIGKHYLSDRRVGIHLLKKKITRSRVLRPLLDAVRRFVRKTNTAKLRTRGDEVRD